MLVGTPVPLTPAPGDLQHPLQAPQVPAGTATPLSETSVDITKRSRTTSLKQYIYTKLYRIVLCALYPSTQEAEAGRLSIVQIQREVLYSQHSSIALVTLS